MKRNALFLSLLCWFTLFFATTSYALTIPASEDSYTAPRNTLSYSTNNANSLIVDASRKSYLYFDLSDIPPDAVVRWAKLRLFLPTVRTPGAGLSVHLVTGTWNESTRLADVPSIVAGSLGMIAPDKMASRRFVTVDVKDTVQKWINGGTLNEGFAIQPIVRAGSPTASVMLTSKEGPVFGLPAELDIEFQPEGGVDKPVTFDQLPPSIRSYFSPIITTQPNISHNAVGLTVRAEGVGLLTYQWVRDGDMIYRSTNAYLPTHGLQSGNYTVVVSNEFASVTSSSVLFVAPITSVAPPDFALVIGGTLPASSPLGAVPVETFYIGKTEVTWGEWRAVRDWAVANGYTDLADVGAGIGDNYPVTHVNWYDVVKWCNARSEKEGKTPVYRLINAAPTPEVLTFAIQGEGFFQVLLPDGSKGYTREGVFKQDANRQIVTRDGYAVTGFVPIPSGATGVNVGHNGVGQITFSNGSSVSFQFWLFGFDNPSGLTVLSENLYSENVLSGTARSAAPGVDGMGKLLQGHLEVDAPPFRAGQEIPFVDPSSNGYRLPSNKEWEFAARGGTETNGHTYSGSDYLDAVGWYLGNSGGDLHQVRKKQANELWIYDMSGNVSEWCESWYPWARGDFRVIRGGGFRGDAEQCSLSNGYLTISSDSSYDDFGFRVALNSSFPGIALVTGGTLPASSPLGAVPVETFYIGKTEVTWGEWRAVRDWAVANGYTDLADVGAGIGDNYPVTHVNWYDVVKWCNARSEKEGKTPVYKDGNVVYRTGKAFYPTEVSLADGYRLPSEEEWEFAARGGTQTHGYIYSGSNNLEVVAWADGSVAYGVGTKQANELGIYDMSGGVWEWCANLDLRLEGTSFGGVSRASRHERVDRRSYVNVNYPADRYSRAGFRVALSAAP